MHIYKYIHIYIKLYRHIISQKRVQFQNLGIQNNIQMIRFTAFRWLSYANNILMPSA